MTKSMKKAIALCLFSMGVVGLMAQSNEFKIDVQKTGAPIQSTMYGIFFEDINYGADGGLYAELVKNRSFEFENPFGGWTPFGNVSVQTQKPCFDRNPHYVRLSYEPALTMKASMGSASGKGRSTTSLYMPALGPAVRRSSCV